MKPLAQGDVALVPVAFLPKALRTVPRDNKRVILAYGEVTGHAHALHGAGATLLESESGQRFLSIMENSFSTLQPRGSEEVIERNEKFTRIMDASGLTLKFRNDDERLKSVLDSMGGTLTLPGEIVQHEEHDGLVLAPGAYALPGQREYEAPEIVRAVAD